MPHVPPAPKRGEIRSGRWTRFQSWCFTLARNGLITALAAIALGSAMYPLFTMDMVEGHDSRCHAVTTTAVIDALSSGPFPLPRLPVLAGGRGAMNILYYCPGAFYAVGFVGLAGAGVYSALRIVCALGFVLGFSGAFSWSARYHGPWGGLLTATVFLFAPYYLADIYFRFAFPEFLSLSILPWILHLGGQFVENGSRWRGLVAAILLGLSITLHVPAAVMSCGMLAIYGLGVVFFNRGSWWRWIILGAAGISIASLYWLPGHLDQPRLNIDLGVHDAQYQFNFRHLSDVLNDDWNIQNLQDPAFHIGLAGVAIFLVAVVLVPVLARRRTRLAFQHVNMLLCTALFVFLVLPGSRFLWDHGSPISEIFFFPFRWLGVAALALAFTSPVAPCTVLAWMEKDGAPPARIVEMGLYLPLILLVLVPGQRLIHARPITAPAPTVSELLKDPQTGIFHDYYIPSGARKPLSGTKDPVVIVSARGKVLHSRSLPAGITAELALQSAGLVRLEAYDFPGWTATLDGRPVPLHRDPGDGTMLLQVPAGPHTIAVTYHWGWLRIFCGLAGLGAVLFLLVYGTPAAGWAGLLWAALSALSLGYAWSTSTPASPAYCLEQAELATRQCRWDDAVSDLRMVPGSAGPLAIQAESLEHSILNGGLLESTRYDDRWFTKASGPSGTTVPFAHAIYTRPIWATFTGRLHVAQPGTYALDLASDDGSYLFIDRRSVLQNGGAHSLKTVHGQMQLDAGDHEVVILYYNGDKGGELFWMWTPPEGYPEIVGPQVLSPGPVSWLGWSIRLARLLETSAGLRK